MPETGTHEVDLAIIGSGGGAFAAAIRATNLGKSVVMIERATVGGTCAVSYTHLTLPTILLV